MAINANKLEKKSFEEVSRFNKIEKVHDLPQAYHYWRKSFLRPKFEVLGYRGMQDLYIKTIGKIASKISGTLIIMSVGSGNCDAEIELAKALRKSGISDYIFYCLDINETMLSRGKLLAEQEEILNFFKFEVRDLNSLTLEPSSVHILFANQSLHHIHSLEHLFKELHTALVDKGAFIINDMIGRNGHMRWPEALNYVDALWEMLGEDKKFNHQLQVINHSFPNLDCSNVGFEGIRSQDILPLLLEFFSAETFLGFINITQPFVGRSYGPNFDPNHNEADKVFINHVAHLDDVLIDRGIVKPTQIIAVFTKYKSNQQRHYKHWSAEYSVRWP